MTTTHDDKAREEATRLLQVAEMIQRASDKGNVTITLQADTALLLARAALSPASSTGQADPGEQWEAAQMDAFNKWMLTASRDISAYSAMCGYMACARANLAAPAQPSSADLSTPSTHAPDMSKTGAEIDACTGDAAQDVRADVRASDIGDRYAHRLALMLECALLDPAGTWNDGHKLLDEYRAEHERAYPSPPTFMGEPLILTPAGSNNGDAAMSAGSENGAGNQEGGAA